MSKHISRREMLLAARSPSIDYGVYEQERNEVPIPPPNACLLYTSDAADE